MANFEEKKYVNYAGLEAFWAGIKKQMYLKGQVDSAITTALVPYATTESVNTAIQGVNGTINGVAARVKTLEDADFGKQISDAQSALQGEIDKKLAIDTFNTKIADYAKTADMEAAIAAEGSRVEGLVTAHTTAVNTKFNDYSTTAQMEAAIKAQADLDKAAWEAADQALEARVNGKIGELNTAKLEIAEASLVDGTPSVAAPKSNVIYLVAAEGASDNVYVEWIYVDSKWERIGTTAADLSNYYTKGQVDGLITGLGDTYYTETEIDGKVEALQGSINGVSGDLSTLAGRVEELETIGGQVNVLEAVKIDGTALEIAADKSVNIQLSGETGLLKDYAKSAKVTEDINTAKSALQGSIDDVSGRVKTLEDADFAGQISAAEGRLNGEIAKKLDASEISKYATVESLNNLGSAVKGTDWEAGKTIMGAYGAASTAAAAAKTADDKAVAAQGTADDALAAANTANSVLKGYTGEGSVKSAVDGVAADAKAYTDDCYAAFKAYTADEIAAIFTAAN